MSNLSKQNTTRPNQYRERVRYFDIGSKVFINAHHPSNSRIVYTCEARVIRLPYHPNAPYKLLVTGVKLSHEKENPTQMKKLLGLKLLRKQENVFNGKDSHWTRQSTDNWVRLEDARANNLVHRAIRNIRREIQKKNHSG